MARWFPFTGVWMECVREDGVRGRDASRQEETSTWAPALQAHAADITKDRVCFKHLIQDTLSVRSKEFPLRTKAGLFRDCHYRRPVVIVSWWLELTRLGEAWMVLRVYWRKQRETKAPRGWRLTTVHVNWMLAMTELIQNKNAVKPSQTKVKASSWIKGNCLESNSWNSSCFLKCIMEMHGDYKFSWGYLSQTV